MEENDIDYCERTISFYLVVPATLEYLVRTMVVLGFERLLFLVEISKIDIPGS